MLTSFALAGFDSATTLQTSMFSIQYELTDSMYMCVCSIVMFSHSIGSPLCSWFSDCTFVFYLFIDGYIQSLLRYFDNAYRTCPIPDENMDEMLELRESAHLEVFSKHLKMSRLRDSTKTGH